MIPRIKALSRDILRIKALSIFILRIKTLSIDDTKDKDTHSA